MATVKVGGAKTKLKDDKSKFMNSCEEEPDSALLRKPIKTSITGFAQASKIFDAATEELKGLLTTECDLLYECKVCRNLFRSLLNFISHKRVYCKEMFKSAVHGHFIKSASMESEISKINHLEASYQEFLKSRKNSEPVVPLERIPLSKDMTEVVENLMKNDEVTTSTDGKVLEVEVQEIPTSTAAVYQNLVPNNDSGDDMCSEITEINGMTAKNNAMLKEDGKFELCGEVACEEESEQVIQISDDDDINQLTCKICDIHFSTRKTLKFHMNYKHVPDRLVYPCTDCREIFATSWSVLRHLYRVHRKTLTQIRRMREAVHSRAFRMNNMPTAYMKKNKKKVIVEEKLTEEERIDQENQAWMDNMETDSELPRCGGCGRSFERRAALAAHTYTCQSRTRALARKPPSFEKKAEKQDEKVQLKKDRPPPPKAQASPNDTAEKLTIKQMKSSIMEKEKTSEDDHKMEIDVDDEGSEDESKTNEESDSETETKNVMLYFPQDVEKANMDALRKLMSEYVDGTGTCKVCKKKYTSSSHLCRHMASHLNWRRYGCKLCNYVNYDKNRLVMHAQTIHKLKGSDEFYMSILRVLPPNEALALSSVPAVMRGEWTVNVNEDAIDSSDSSERAASSDESECSSSRTEPIQCNRRKQTFKPAKVVKTKSSSPVKDEQPEKVGTKRPSTVPLEKVMQVVLSENESDKSKPKNQIYKSDEPDTTSRRPIRKRMRPKKDEDFEYDLSNVLKWENNAYRESHSESKVTATSRTITMKRRSNAEASPTESSPEKPEKDKSDKEKEKEEQTPTQVKNEEKKKMYVGSLAAMSDTAISLSQAHLRPSLSIFTSRPQLAGQKLPFDIQSHFRNIPPSKLVLSSQDVTTQRKISVKYTKHKDPKTEKGKSDNKEDVDIEKQIDEANARNKFVTALKNTSASLLHHAKKNAETKQPNPEIAKNTEMDKANILTDTDVEVNDKPNIVMTKNVEINDPNPMIAPDTEVNKQIPPIASRQKWIVMKRINANEEASESSGQIQFPRIKSLENAMKSTAGNKMPAAPSTNQTDNKITKKGVEMDNVDEHIKKDPLNESVEVLSISKKGDEASQNDEKT